MVVLAAACFLPARLPAQAYAQYGSGVATKYAYFDPSAPLPPARIPQGGSSSTVLARPPVIPEAEYLLRKSVTPRLPQGAPSIVSRSPDGSALLPSRLPLALSPTLSFEGIAQTTYTPPSPNIAVGPNDVLQVVNSTIVPYTRGGQAGTPVTMGQWFSSFMGTVCASGNCTLGDVSITYDQMHGHFILMLGAQDFYHLTSYLLLSVSNTASYSGGWKSWILDETMDGSTSTGNWADFPQPGIDNVAFYATSLQFSLASGSYQYSKVRIIKKTDLYNTALTQLPYKDIYNLQNEDGTMASTLQVPHLRGRTEVGTSTGIMVNSSDADNADYYTLWQINNPTGSIPTVTRITIPNAWKYSYPSAAPQLNSTVTLDTGPSSIAKAVMRDGLVYFALNTGYTDEPVTVTYSVVDTLKKKLTLQQRLTNGNYFYPAFDVPASIGPGSVLPNNPIVGTTTSSTGSLAYAGIMNLQAGQAPYTVVGNNGSARWGDFFGAAVDPVQGGMWVSGEYAKGTSTWGTWNAYYPWATTQEFSDVDTSRSSFAYVNVMKLWGITVGCGNGMYCPDQNITRAQMAVFVIRALYGDTFTYSSTPYFSDVPATDPNFAYVQKFKELGITAGCSATTFCPGDPLTRWQAATFIVRAKMSKLYGGDAFPYITTPYFSDVVSTDVSFPFVQKLRELGITTGCSATTFCPNDPLTREQMAVFVVRAFLN